VKTAPSRIVALILTVLAATVMLPLRAEHTAPATPPRLQVRLIRATMDPPEQSDPKVRSLIAQLRADFGYNNYQQLSLSETDFTKDEKALFEMPDDFKIMISYHGQKDGNHEFWVEIEYREKKFLGLYASFAENSKPAIIRGPGTRESRYLIALTLKQPEPPAKDSQTGPSPDISRSKEKL